MKLVCGIHGSGKTRYSYLLGLKLGLQSFEASKLIDKSISLNQNGTKRIDYIDESQEELVYEAKELHKIYGDFILDGHLTLINTKGEIEWVSVNVFERLNIEELWIVIADENEILDRIEKRDKIKWNIDFIKKFQEEELMYARILAKTLNIKLNIINTSQKDSIILPIAPKYVDKILEGEKKYEFRKKMCIKDIKRIYLYATNPKKQILGEVEVLDKVTMDKEKLWSIVAKQSGITYEYYSKYFEGYKKGNAYKLGSSIRYENGIKLQDLGIAYTPQSHVYVSSL